MPKVSIIIPIYNVEQYLRQALDSCINQTLKDIEIICIDDCSTDNSLSIVKEYASKDKRFVIIEQKSNQGTGVTRNVGMKKATGAYIMFLDPDDWYELDACEKAYNQISKYKNDYCIFNYYIYKEGLNEKNVNINMQIQYEATSYSHSLNPNNDYISYIGYSASKIYNKNFLINNNCEFAKTRDGEDIPFAVKVGLLAKSVSTSPEPIFVFRNFIKPNKYRKNVLRRREKNYQELFSCFGITRDLLLNINKAKCFKEYCFIHFINMILFRYHRQISKHPLDKIKLYKIIRNIFLDFNKACTIDIQKGIKYVSPETKLSQEEIDNTTKTSIENKIFVKKVNAKKYKIFKNIIKYKTWYEYDLFVNILPSIFSVKNEYQKNNKHKVITILGIKLKYKICKK